jgi:hypothetical protein
MAPDKKENQRQVPSWGGPLTDGDYADLANSWITPEIAEQAMLRRVDSAQGRAAIAEKGNRDCAGILFPFYWPGETQIRCYRLRRDNPDWKQGKDGTLKADRKYLAEPGAGNRLYVPPGITPAQLADVVVPIVIVEGEKKSLAAQTLAYYEAEQPRFIPIAVTGVWNWLGVVGKAGGPKGERVDVKGPITDLDRIAWKGRPVFILFDANTATNDSVKFARKGLARELATRLADVKFIDLPPDCGVNGVDDLLAKWGAERVLALFNRPTPGAGPCVAIPPQFQSTPDGMFRTTVKGEQVTQCQLTNYQASVVTNICLDDGVETKCEFQMAAGLFGRSYQLTVSASRFSAMNWPIELMGPQAITYPNQREYARAAIQCFSISAEEQRVYTHSGWREIDGHAVFLHASGAIGENGIVPGVNVNLPGALARFELSSASQLTTLAAAVRAGLNLIELAPPTVSFPILAAVFRSVFGGADFSLHLVGETGAFKSELAALAQQFFGPRMDRTHLPGSWSSTANSLETLVFHAKDVVIVIDDFAPQGNAADVARYHAAGERVFRAAGNQSGRGRLDSTARLREPKPPRGLILSTGEEIPRGHSVRARVLILEISKGEIDAARLTECQTVGRGGVYAHAMTGFLIWLAGRLEQARESLNQRATELRLKALRDPAHARTPDIIANLQAAFESFLTFAEECGAIDTDQRERLASACWRALRETALAQAKHHAASEPTARFLAVLRAALVSGAAHLAPRTGSEPDQPDSCGWRRHSNDHWGPQGKCIGWIDGADIYLEFTAAYQVAQIASRDSGDALSVTEQTLKKRLREKGLVASVDNKHKTLTVRRTICGSLRNVLHIFRTTILPAGSEEPEASGER